MTLATHYTKGNPIHSEPCHALCSLTMCVTNDDLTTDYTKVTCKRCLKMLDKQNTKTLESAKIAVDDINRPKHYNIGKIQTADYIIDKKLNFIDGNIIKYISRATHKGTEIADRKKALWYIIKSMILIMGKTKALDAVVQTIKYFSDDDVNTNEKH